MKILIVDDEKEICGLARRVLAMANIPIDEFECCDDLWNGLAKCREMHPDITLIDFNMVGSATPSMTVSTIPEFVKCSGGVIGITGLQLQATDELFVQAIKNGASDVLFKRDALSPRNEGRLAKAIAICQLTKHRGRPKA